MFHCHVSWFTYLVSPRAMYHEALMSDIIQRTVGNQLFQLFQTRFFWVVQTQIFWGKQWYNFADSTRG